MSSNDKAKIYTFYSYKGGVGRSMALANIGELLYQSGLRVLMIDFDLEAPGLETYFYEGDDPELQKLVGSRGVIDLLFSYRSLRALNDASLSDAVSSGLSDAPNSPSEINKQSASPKFPYPVEPLSSFISTIYPASSNISGELSIMTAGRRAKEELMPEREEKQTKDEFALYADRVRSFAWDDFYLNWDGERFFDWFREEVIKNIDIVLVDSRTGVAEMSGVCTYQLADIVVMFVASNNQNVEGVRQIAESLTNRKLISEGRKGRELSLIFVPTRVDMTEKSKLDDLYVRFRKVVDKLISPTLRFKTDSFIDLMIPYVPYYSFVEQVAVRESTSPAAIKLREAYERICRSFSQLDPKVKAKLKAKLKLEPESADETNVSEYQNRVANLAYALLTPPEQESARSLFKRLVRVAQLDEGEMKDSPRSVKLEDLTPDEQRLAGSFSNRGLLVITKDESGQETVGLAWERLIETWDLFKNWIDQDREFLIWRQYLQSAFSRWEKKSRSNSDLMAGSRLEEAEKWFASRAEDLNKAESNYISESILLRDQKLRDRRLQLVGVALGVVLVTFTINYLYQKNRQQNILAARSRQLASNSETLITLQPELSALLAVEASRVAATAEAQQALRNVWLQSRLLTVIRVGAPVYSAQFSHDGNRIVTGSGGDTSLAQIWQKGGNGSWQNLIVLSGHLGAVRAAAFSPDDQVIATASDDGTAILWNAASGKRIGVLKAGPGSLTDIDWSVKGEFVAASAQDNMVYVWNAKSQELIERLKLFTDNVNSVSFSPNGQFLAAGSKDRQIYIWDAPDLGVNHNPAYGPLTGHSDAVLSVLFSQDSQLLVTASRDSTARIWRTSDWRTITVLSGHLNAVTRAAFSADGKLIVTASEDNTSIVWETATGKSLVTLRAGLVGFVNDASFSLDGRLVLTGSGDGTARLWEVNPTVNPNSSATELASAACTRLTRNMTAEEWRQYMGNETYRATCANIPLPQPTFTPTPGVTSTR